MLKFTVWHQPEYIFFLTEIMVIFGGFEKPPFQRSTKMSLIVFIAEKCTHQKGFIEVILLLLSNNKIRLFIQFRKCVSVANFLLLHFVYFCICVFRPLFLKHCIWLKFEHFDLSHNNNKEKKRMSSAWNNANGLSLITAPNYSFCPNRIFVGGFDSKV